MLQPLHSINPDVGIVAPPKIVVRNFKMNVITNIFDPKAQNTCEENSGFTYVKMTISKKKMLSKVKCDKHKSKYNFSQVSLKSSFRRINGNSFAHTCELFFSYLIL